MLALVSCPGTAHAKMFFAVRWWPVYCSSILQGANVSVGNLLHIGSLQDCVVTVSIGEYPSKCLLVVVVESEMADFFGCADDQEVRTHL